MTQLAQSIKLGLERVRRYFEVPNGLLVNTDCLYPSNGVVQVAVMGSGSSYFVTDQGGAVKTAERAGAHIPHPDCAHAKLLKRQGVLIRNGAIRSPDVSLDNVASAIVLVANASKEFADAIFESYRINRERNFKEV